jgi:hypothetical protein
MPVRYVHALLGAAALLCASAGAHQTPDLAGTETEPHDIKSHP